MKTAGKYALMSFPRIGLVDVGQKNVAYLADKSKALETSYDVDVPRMLYENNLLQFWRRLIVFMLTPYKNVSTCKLQNGLLN